MKITYLWMFLKILNVHKICYRKIWSSFRTRELLKVYASIVVEFLWICIFSHKFCVIIIWKLYAYTISTRSSIRGISDSNNVINIKVNINSSFASLLMTRMNTKGQTVKGCERTWKTRLPHRKKTKWNGLKEQNGMVLENKMEQSWEDNLNISNVRL